MRWTTHAEVGRSDTAVAAVENPVIDGAYRAGMQGGNVDIERSHAKDRRAGITLIELLVVIAIIGVVAGLAAVSGRVIAQNARERAALNTVQQVVWQGATLAAARGFRTVLCRDATDLSVRQVVDRDAPDCNGDVLRDFEIDEAVTLTGIEDGMSMVFTPPGTIAGGTLPESIELTASGSTYALEVSLIGEVRVQ
jgi:prepilin-type N-terminal cleavage/methylation domain-containing protein